MNNLDDYGFDKKEYDKSNIKSNFKSKIRFYIKLIIIILLIIYLCFSTLAIWISWNTFLNDPEWLKISKTILAGIFSPVYLFYIFLRSVIFKIPN